MNRYERHILPRIVNVACARAEIREKRARIVENLAGRVVEIGFGSGLNVPYYPAGVDRVLAVDPSIVGRRLAARRLAGSTVPVDFVGLDGEVLPLATGSADAALITFTLCTIPDAGRALDELHRVLRPGGRLHFLEHGLSPEPGVARWQHRLTPIQRKLFGGCHLDRAIDDLLGGHRFEVTTLRSYYLKGPKAVGYIYEGVARAAG